MNYKIIKMPSLFSEMEEGIISKWIVMPGDLVRTGDVLAEIETDKAIIEFAAEIDGKIIEILIYEGKSKVKVNTPIAIIENISINSDTDNKLPNFDERFVKKDANNSLPLTTELEIMTHKKDQIDDAKEEDEYEGIGGWIIKYRISLMALFSFIGISYLFFDFTEGTWLEGKFLETISVSIVLIFFYAEVFLKKKKK